MAQGADAPAQPKPAKVDYLRIATEEAWAPPELFAIYRDILNKGTYDDPGFRSLWGFYAFSEAARPAFIRSRMTDLGALRLSEMDASGIDKQLLMLTAPGVQVM